MFITPQLNDIVGCEVNVPKVKPSGIELNKVPNVAVVVILPPLYTETVGAAVK